MDSKNVDELLWRSGKKLWTFELLAGPQITPLYRNCFELLQGPIIRHHRIFLPVRQYRNYIYLRICSQKSVHFVIAGVPLSGIINIVVKSWWSLNLWFVFFARDISRGAGTFFGGVKGSYFLAGLFDCQTLHGKSTAQRPPNQLVIG